MIKVVLFDLDGTLLPMDQEAFMKAYMGTMAQKLAPHGYAPEKLAPVVWNGVKAMVTNNGTRTNEEAFWETFCAVFGEKAREDAPIFEEYYQNEFQTVQNSCGYDARAKQIVTRLQEKGYRVVLATNPLFPSVATESRIKWAGLEPGDFELFTTYEHYHYCKPNPNYYFEILEKLGVAPEDCMMIGNDVTEDMMTKDLGMQVFLLTGSLINKENKDISVYPNGDFDDLLTYIEEML